MKLFIFLFLFTTVFRFSAFAQTVKPKIPALPADVASWNGENSDKILEDPIIKTRLKKLLGEKNYAAFLESFETLTPIEKTGDILFASGCLIHACQHLESAVAIDFSRNIIYAAIYRETEKTRYFRERGGKTPESITKWANRLSDLNNKQSKANRNDK